jgi:hypothetical protein
MKRRNLLRSMVAAPALAAIPRPAAAQTNKVNSTVENFNVPVTGPEAVATAKPQFFPASQLAALENLGNLLVPKWGERPGSQESAASQFLDFLISHSPEERKLLYTNGLERLNSEARRIHKKTFAALTASEAAAILKPLESPWTYAGPADPFAQFLLAAKEDFLRASVNSPAYSRAMAATTRGSSGVNYYWFPVE